MRWRSMSALLVGLVCGASACKHTGDLRTRDDGYLALDNDGVPRGGVEYRCPSNNGEGQIRLTHANGKKRLEGECKGGVMVGRWKGFYENGATAWKAAFEHGRLAGRFESSYANDKRRAEVDFAVLGDDVDEAVGRLELRELRERERDLVGLRIGLVADVVLVEERAALADAGEGDDARHLRAGLQEPAAVGPAILGTGHRLASHR